MKLSDGLRAVFLAGVGAVAVTGEKSKKIIDDLVKKGELTVEEGKILNEDLAKNFGEKVNEKTKKVAERAGNINVSKDALKSQIIDVLVNIDKMTQDERDALREKLDAADQAAKAKAAEIKASAGEVIDAILKDAVEDGTTEGETEDALEDAEKAVAESVAETDEAAAAEGEEVVEAIVEEATEDQTVEAEQEDAIEDAMDAVADAPDAEAVEAAGEVVEAIVSETAEENAAPAEEDDAIETAENAVADAVDAEN